ncbi:MAG: glucosaminidase domain-containing protein [Acidimicrobiia bacterium]
MRARRVTSVVLAAGLLVASCAPSSSKPPGTATDPTIMGSQTLTATDLEAWFVSVKGSATNHRLPSAVGTAGTAIRNLARMFIEEGRDEGVRGDIAFAQSVLETGWFWFPDGGRVRPWYNNYAGIGAVDNGTTANEFATPREGVRAQIQHLRAYGDPTVTAGNLAHPLVDPRFGLVSPRGKAPTWLGLSGTWASSTTYGSRIIELFTAAAAHAHASVVHPAYPTRDVAARPGGGHYVLFGDGTVVARDGAPDFGDKSFGFDIARALAVMPDGQGYVMLDGFGGLHKFGSARSGAMKTLSGPYWQGWDIANALAVTTDGAGLIVMDGFGGLHPRGTAPTATGTAYWPNWDIARDVEVDDDGGVYVLDGWGGVHNYNGAANYGSKYWKGWDIARDLVVLPDGSGYSMFEGWGGIHNRGTAPPSGAFWAPADKWSSASWTGTGYVAAQRSGTSAVG